MIYWLNRLIECGDINSIVDFGGHTGVEFRAYRKYLHLPQDLTWQVVDAPSAVAHGQELVQCNDLASLTFSADLSTLSQPDILLCSCSLHIEEFKNLNPGKRNRQGVFKFPR